ncbi:hypothetical protein A7A08_01325 [Methyloligella halotolerans]|uniref:Uncharacterized protein n=1 Tax=Methyloligella halotolerans TaxID=1177755 RepID=A0A1E2S121_9HYPH|nr:hypothetical protein A7A08_01325 [Methyloligella halotolerans]
MGVAGAGQILGRATELHKNGGFGDHVARVRAQDVDAEDPVGLLVGENLHEASVVRFTLARPLAVKGNLPTVYSTPSSFSCSSVLPTLATSGSV